MGLGKQLVECIPNFSEGRDTDCIENIVQPFRATEGVRLLDYQYDTDHNRTVVTAVGTPRGMTRAVLAAVDEAVRRIDMTRHRGGHPRMGAVDVVPFVPVRNVTMDEAIALSVDVAGQLAATFGLPVFLYEASASRPERENLATIRKGEFEGMAEKLKDARWKPDYGPDAVHPTAGVVAVGARKPLVAFNVNLATGDVEIARKIASLLRHKTGGLRYCKAIGIALDRTDMTQVSMNLTDYSRTAIYRALELVRMEARRYGVAVLGTEIVGLTPMAALVETAAYYLQLENFTLAQVLESHLLA